MLNILVVCESFTKGGLETHIHAYYTALRQDHRFVFAFRHYESELALDPQDVHADFHFGWDCSVESFIDDVEHLVELIREYEIDVIHTHPFHSVFPAAVAGQLAGVPVVCTHHGTYSYAFPTGLIESLLLRYAYTELLQCVFSVSLLGKEDLERRVHVSQVEYIPNAIDAQLYRRHTVANNRRWAVVTRLDSDSGAATVKALLDMLPQLPISAIDIYGAGGNRRELEEYTAEQGLSDRVRFMGWCSDLFDRLDGNYNGIFGQGRVAMEGLIMGYPVLGLGYGCVCGLLHGQTLTLAKNNNFVANLLPRLDAASVAAQLEQVYAHPERFDARQEILEHFDIRGISDAYIKRLRALASSPAPSRANVIGWFAALKALPDRTAQFHVSREVFQTLAQHIKPYVVDQDILDLFVLGSGCAMLDDRTGWLQTSLEEQGRRLEQLSQLDAAQSRLQAALEEQSRLVEEQSRLVEEQAQKLEQQAQLLEGQAQALAQQEQETERQAQALAQQEQEAERHRQLLAQQAQALEQQQEQLTAHRKVLAPLLWLRRLLSRVKWTIKGWLR